MKQCCCAICKDRNICSSLNKETLDPKEWKLDYTVKICEVDPSLLRKS